MRFELIAILAAAVSVGAVTETQRLMVQKLQAAASIVGYKVREQSYNNDWRGLLSNDGRTLFYCHVDPENADTWKAVAEGLVKESGRIPLNQNVTDATLIIGPSLRMLLRGDEVEVESLTKSLRKEMMTCYICNKVMDNKDVNTPQCLKCDARICGQCSGAQIKERASFYMENMSAFFQAKTDEAKDELMGSRCPKCNHVRHADMPDVRNAMIQALAELVRVPQH